MAKILVVEDDAETAELVCDWLTSIEHHNVEVLNNGHDAMAALKLYQYDILVLDRQLPGAGGIEICRSFRSKGGHTPILMLTAMDSVDDKESGFDNGVDDYLTKPFHLKELAARIRALLKRPQMFTGELKAGDITLDTQSLTVTKGGSEIKLMPREFALLEFLLRHQGKVFTVSELLSGVWNSDSLAGPEALRQCVKRLRQKIDTAGEPSLIQNLPRQGYTIKRT